jgi:alkanesulfonate monooxygenase SsuD/methylene tetrahydromethanopterin reductase-like flavin-dependent oxidoreductase (luciferase family)
MVEEFEALGASFKERGQIADEQLEVVGRLWTEDRPRFDGRYYQFAAVGFAPKPFQGPRIPIWVGGEGTPAQRRAGRYGDAWFPYFVRITPSELRTRFDHVRRVAAEAGRDPDGLQLCCCLPLELTPEPVPQEPDRLHGTARQVAEALEAFRAVGVRHVALQFMVPRWPARLEQIERFAREGLPALR